MATICDADGNATQTKQWHHDFQQSFQVRKVLVHNFLDTCSEQVQEISWSWALSAPGDIL